MPERASSSRILTRSSIHAFVFVRQNALFLSANVNDAIWEGGWARGASCRRPVLRWALELHVSAARSD